MADINQTAAWVTARLTELGDATDDGNHILITNENIGDFNNRRGIVSWQLHQYM